MPRVAVIGAGNWGIKHVKVFHSLGALAAVVDADEALRARIKERYPRLAVYASPGELFAGPAADAVVVASPADTHHEIALAALNAGQDVLVEKPMALSVEEAESLVAAAGRHDRVLMVGHLLLFKPAVQKIVESVRAGLIGRLCHVQMRRAKLGRVRRHENVLWSFAPHDVAVLLHLVGAPVKRVTAAGMAVLQPGIEDDVHLHLAFSNGVQAHVHASWLWPEDERKTVIVGTAGMITYDEHENRVWLHQKTVAGDLSVSDGGRRELTFQEKDALEEEALHFLHCIGERAVPLTCGKSGREVIEVLVRAGGSLQQGPPPGDCFIHESAYVDQPDGLGPGSQVWHYSHLMPGVETGRKCKIGQNVFIGKNVKIGHNVKIQNNVSVYEGVVLEDDVFCGPSMVFTNIRTPRSAYPRNTAGDYVATRVKRGASIGANATVVCGVTVGRHALVGAGALVTRDVPDHAVVYGNPAAVRGWICRCGDTVASSAAELQCGRCSTGGIDR